MLQATRIPSRFVGLAPGEYLVVGLSFKREQSSAQTEFGFFDHDYKFKIGDVETPIDILSALQISEQKILN